MTTESTPATYYRSEGYSMIDHQLDPLMEVALSWLNYPDTTDERRQQDAEAIAATLESAAAYLRMAGQRCEPLHIECLICGAAAGQGCWTTEEESRARVVTMTDADLIDHWGGEDELRTWGNVPALADMRRDTEQEHAYEDRAEPHAERVEDAANLFRHEVLGW